MPKARASSPPEKNRRLCAAFDEVQAGHNLDLINELFGREFVNRTGLSGLNADRGALKGICRKWPRAFPNTRVTIGDMIAEGDKVEPFNRPACR